MSSVGKYRRLDSEALVQTIDQLRARVEERFPGSGLSQVAAELQQIGKHAVERSAWIARPNLPLRAGMAVLSVALVGTILMTLFKLDLPQKLQSWTEFLQGFDSGLNSIVLIGAAIFSLFTLEARLKRQRALTALHELRSLAHIIDMHQLPKDPHQVPGEIIPTKSSPKRSMSRFELSRYLDYCSEMLSLTGKIAALYVQNFNDPVVLSSVDQIEDLTNSLSRKIWQKITIINSASGA
jgi:hypothetical protein